MKRRCAPKQSEPVRPLPDTLASAGRGLLFLHLASTPLAISQSTVEGFEFVKLLCLLLTGLLLAAMAALALPRLTCEAFKREMKQPMVLAGLAFLGSALISTLGSRSPLTSLYGHHENFEGLVTLLSYGVLYFASRWLLQTPDQMRMMLAAVVLACVATTTYGFVQACKLDPLVWQDVSKVGSSKRPFSTFGHPNFLGAYLVLALPLVTWLSTTVPRWLRIGLGLLAIAMCGLIVLTLSRGAWLGLAGTAVIWGLGWRLSRRALPFYAILIGLVVLVAGTTILAEIMPDIMKRSRRFFDSAGRFQIWSAAWKIFLDRPLIGCGPDVFPQVFGRFGGAAYRNTFWGDTPARAHNEFLQILATQGALGFLALLTGQVALGWSLHRAWKQQPSQRGLIIALAAALGGYLITEVFGFTVIACGSLVAVLLAMASRLGEVDEPHLASANGRPTLIAWRIPQAVMLATCGWLIVALVADPWRASVRSAEAETLATTHPENALRLHEEAVRICPHEPVHWNRLAMHAEVMASAFDDPDQQIVLLQRARACYAEAATRDREDGYYRAGVGRTLGELARLGQATPEASYAAFTMALRFDPNNAYTYVDACRASLRLGDAERLRQYSDDGLRLFPTFGLLREQVALRWLLLNRPEEAKEAFETALQADWKRHWEKEYPRCAAIYEEFCRRMEKKAARSPIGAAH